jgi:hypothetical protein
VQIPADIAFIPASCSAHWGPVVNQGPGKPPNEPGCGLGYGCDLDDDDGVLDGEDALSHDPYEHAQEGDGEGVPDGEDIGPAVRNRGQRGSVGRSVVTRTERTGVPSIAGVARTSGP